MQMYPGNREQVNQVSKEGNNYAVCILMDGYRLTRAQLKTSYRLCQHGQNTLNMSVTRQNFEHV